MVDLLSRSPPLAQRRHAVLDTVLIEGVLLHNSGRSTSTHRERMGKTYQLRRSGDLWMREAATGAWTRCITRSVAPLELLPHRAGFKVRDAAFMFPDALGHVERDAWLDALRTAQSEVCKPAARHARSQLKRFTSCEPGCEVALVDEKESPALWGSREELFGDLRVEPLEAERTTPANARAALSGVELHHLDTETKVTVKASKSKRREATARARVSYADMEDDVETDGKSALDNETRSAVDALLNTVSRMRALSSAAGAAARAREQIAAHRSRVDACDFGPRAGEELRALIDAHWLSRGDIEELAGCRALDVASLCTLLAPDSGACVPGYMVTRRAFAGAMLESVGEGGGGSGSAWHHARGLSIALIDALFSALASPSSEQESTFHHRTTTSGFSFRGSDGKSDTAQPLVGSACVDLPETARFEHLIAGLALLCGGDDDALAHALFAVGDVGLVPHEDVVAPRRWRCGLVSRVMVRRFFGTAYVKKFSHSNDMHTGTKSCLHEQLAGRLHCLTPNTQISRKISRNLTHTTRLESLLL